METLSKRFQNVYQMFRSRTLSLVSHAPEDISDIRADDLSSRDIIFSIRKLDSKREMTPDEKILAIRRIGVASWVGGPVALHKAGDFLPRLLALYGSPSENVDVKIEVLKTVSTICCLNPPYQDLLREEGFIDEMVEMLSFEFPGFVELQKWIIYGLICLIIDHVTNQKYLLAMEDLPKIVRKFQTESWFCWGRNEAKHLLDILGFEARK